MWTEYLNRLLGVLVGLLILATTMSAWRRHRRQPHIIWPVVAALLLTGYQGWLGGRVVAHELAPWIVTVHLVVALIIVSLLLYATVYALLVRRGPVRSRVERTGLTWATLVVIVVSLAQVALGTQVRGRVDDALARSDRGTALATVGALDWWHRDLALAVFGGAIVLTLMVRARYAFERPLVLAAYAVVGFTAAQLGIGLILAYGGLPPAAQVAHLALASLLLGAMTVLFLLARWLPTMGTP